VTKVSVRDYKTIRHIKIPKYEHHDEEVLSR
jgi:hypothetical protein